MRSSHIRCRIGGTKKTSFWRCLRALQPCEYGPSFQRAYGRLSDRKGLLVQEHGREALAKEFGLDPDDSFVWYKVIKKAPERFVES